MLVRRAAPLLTIILFSAISFAQSHDVAPTYADAPAAAPTVSFELTWPQADPQWYSISISSTGAVTYKSQPRLQDHETAGDPFTMEFTATEETRTRIFDLAKATNYFQGDFEFKGNIAKTGTKTLTYRDGDKESHTTINYSGNPQLMQEVSIFQNISNTMELGRRLAFQIRFDKLGVDALLKRMEELDKQGSLLEIQAIEPVLKQIATDRSFMNIARQRAQRLLRMPVSPSGSR
jgi:hypothetical protein